MADQPIRGLQSQSSVTDSDIVPVSNEGTSSAYKVTMPAFKEYLTSIMATSFSNITIDTDYVDGAQGVYEEALATIIIANLFLYNATEVGDSFYLPSEPADQQYRTVIDKMAGQTARVIQDIPVGWGSSDFSVAKGPLVVKNSGEVTSFVTDKEIFVETVITDSIVSKSAYKGEIKIGSFGSIRISQTTGVVSLLGQSGIVSNSTAFNLTADDTLYDIKPTVLQYESAGEYNPATGAFTPIETGIYSCTVSCQGEMSISSGTSINPYVYVTIDNLPPSVSHTKETAWSTYPAISDFDILVRVSATVQLITGTAYKVQIRPYAVSAATASYVGTLALSIMRIA